ncbi:hypothetical protein CBP52_12815 [Cellulomonas sp. PSBB021]|nr:hypothetical protein CBP52_12815 [Cellulomonas sp. PSBB021]
MVRESVSATASVALAVAVAVAAVAAVAPVAMAAIPAKVTVEGDEDRLAAGAFQAEHDRRLDAARGIYEYERTSQCKVPRPEGTECPAPIPPIDLVCEEGAPVSPLWRRLRSDSADEWHLRWGWSCPEDLQPPFTENDLRQLKVKAVEVQHQPVDGPMLITKPVIVYAEPTAQEFRVRLMDFYDVDVVVTPREYTWEFGDGGTLTTADPGRPYPAFDLTHVYESLGKARITLRTAWSAKYRVDTDQLRRWRDAEGSVFTVDEGEEFEVIELRSTLVD